MWKDTEIIRRYENGAWLSVWENYSHIFQPTGSLLRGGSEFTAPGNQSASGVFQMNSMEEYVTYEYTLPAGLLFSQFRFHLQLTGQVWNDNTGYATCYGFQIWYRTYRSGNWSDWYEDSIYPPFSTKTVYDGIVTCRVNSYLYQDCSKLQVRFYFKISGISTSKSVWYTITGFEFNNQRSKLEAAHYIG